MLSEKHNSRKPGIGTDEKAMECNKEEAIRAMEIAEKKLSEKDFTGAKQLLIRAQKLYSSLEGVKKMTAIVNVLVASQSKINGEVDCYAILSLDPSADDESVRKQYKSLALQLHPDKNKFTGSEPAFKLVSEAFGVLSDKSKRMLYDLKRRNSVVGRVKVAKDQYAPSNPANSSQNISTFWSGCHGCRMQYQYDRKFLNRIIVCPSCQGPFTAREWSSNSEQPKQNGNPCARTSNVYYSSDSASLEEIKRRSERSFAMHTKVGKLQAELKRKDADRAKIIREHAQGQAVHMNGPKHSGPNTDLVNQINKKLRRNQEQEQTATKEATGSASNSADVSNKRNEKLMRNCEAQTTARTEAGKKTTESAKRKTCKIVDDDASGPDNPSLKRERGDSSSDVGIDMNISGTGGASGCSDVNSSGGVHGDASKSRMTAGKKSAIRRNNDFSLQIRSFLLDETRSLICKKLQDWKAAAAAASAEEEKENQAEKQSDGQEKERQEIKQRAEQVKEKQKVEQNAEWEYKRQKRKESNEQNKEKQNERQSAEQRKEKQKGKESAEQVQMDVDHRVATNEKMGDCTGKDEKLVAAKKENNSDEDTLEPAEFEVPDPDFHNFDNDRTERSIKSDEIWATYDDEDGMPRYYALIQRVVSLKPFKVRMAYLNSRSNTEFGSLNWVNSGFPKSCGEFRVSKYLNNDSLNIFSHKVKWEKYPHGVIKIMPRKGDIWALYRNWSPDWDKHTPDDVMYKYDMVEILEDFSENHGIKIAPLVKVTGFRTVFHRHPDEEQVIRIPKEEMFRFSHQVPACLLTGEEGNNAPKGYYDLDPASLPVDLLRVGAEGKEDEDRERTMINLDVL